MTKIFETLDKSIMKPAEQSNIKDKIIQNCALLVIAFFIAMFMLLPLWIPLIIIWLTGNS